RSHLRQVRGAAHPRRLPALGASGPEWARRDRACLQPPRSGACDFPEIGKPVHGRSWHDGVLIVTSPFDTPPSFPVAGRDGGCLAPTSVTTLSGRDGSSAGLSVIPAKAGIQERRMFVILKRQ